MSKRMDGIAPQQTENTPAKIEQPVPTEQTLPAVTKTSPDEEKYETLFPEPVVAVSAPPTWVWWGLLGVATVGLGVLGYNVANGKVSAWLSPASTPSNQAIKLTSTSSPSPSSTSTTSATPQPTATAVAATTPSAAATSSPNAQAAITVRILNGTPAEGAATKAKTTLTAAGFSISSIGNSKSSYTSTIIYYQTGHSENAQAVAKALNKYQSTIQESSSLASPDTVLVVLGPAS